MNEVIKTDRLSKDFGNLHAVNSISLSVGKGEIYGFLGLNGAGKTTTIRMLLGMIKPTSGTAYLNGKLVNAGETELWKNVGYLVELPYSYSDLTVKEKLEIIRRLRGIDDTNAISAGMGKLQLNKYADRKAGKLSQGNRQRLGIAKALIHNPEILILDEPSNGLDPAGIVEIRELLLDLALNKGVTVFISSHILSEVSKIASRIGIIHEGVLIQEIDADRLEHLRLKKLVVNTVDNEKAKTILLAGGYDAVLSQDRNLIITDERAINHPEKIAEVLVHSGCPPVLLMVEEEDLESYFLRSIREKVSVK
ncbi:ABC transporter ATP-binding protein [Methanosarcina sp. T3]|uniref:ABC transporter ATP-binding protein n=1 Tax=Methanosarcina sp. T3 TaxID=3439062 RepID=UPI003F835036